MSPDPVPIDIHPAPRRLGPQLQAQTLVKTIDPLRVHRPAHPTQQHVHTPVTVAHARRTDVLDPGFEPGLIVPTSLVVVGGRVDLENPARTPDRLASE